MVYKNAIIIHKFFLCRRRVHRGVKILVLSNASYLQGLMEQFDGDISGIGNSTCGQKITFGFLMQLLEKSVDEPPNPLPKPAGGGNYSVNTRSWEYLWTDRRVKYICTGFQNNCS